ncbi:MAG: Y-family DNA polymerase [Dysgonomonas sp.]
MFALVDCNNFYASCERVFRPDYRNVPIVVLSNNDGCVIARSNESKKLGIKMGVPAYQIKDEVRKYGIKVFSSNYTLYGDMSNRVMTILSSFTPNVEIYSIDEAFLDFTGFDNLPEYGKHIVDTTTRWTGIPVSMGVAPTKTLAKVANKFAKKYKGYKGVCVIDTDEKRIKALQKTDIGDVWGIGRRNEKKLKQQGVNTAYDFTQLQRSWVRKYMTVVGERTWLELNGISCISLEEVQPDKKQICTSRAFGKTVSNIEDLKEAIAYYVSVCAEKLRKQRSCAVSLLVFIQTNSFREDLPQYFNNKTIDLLVPSNSTLEITKYALMALESIYRDGFEYKKAGVIITEIVPDSGIQTNLFDNVDREKHTRLMKVVDNLNSGFTSNVLNLAIQGQHKKWNLKRELLSPCYTTKVSDLIQIK